MSSSTRHEAPIDDGLAKNDGVVKDDDPFDLVERSEQNERKRQVVELGVRRVDGTYRFENATYNDLEDALRAAEAKSSSPVLGEQPRDLKPWNKAGWGDTDAPSA